MPPGVTNISSRVTTKSGAYFYKNSTSVSKNQALRNQMMEESPPRGGRNDRNQDVEQHQDTLPQLHIRVIFINFDLSRIRVNSERSTPYL